MIYKRIKQILYIFILLIPSCSFAAQAFFIYPQSTVGENKDVVVDVYIDTAGISVNAVEGTISFPTDLLSVSDIRNGNSSINFWIDAPHLNDQNKISFSGITPGGVANKAYLFSVVFHTIKKGQSKIVFDQISALQNNGKGEQIKIIASSTDILIVQSDNSKNSILTIVDKDIPDDFVPQVVKNPEMFEGKYFVVFVAQDKGSGIDHYEIKEGYWDKYKVASSPYILEDQNGSKKIYLKAFDKKGNQRVSYVSPANPLPWYRDYSILVIILLSVLVYFYLRKLWQRYI